MKRLLLLACICSCLLLSCIDNRARVMSNVQNCFPPGATNIQALASSPYWYSFDLKSKHYYAFIEISGYGDAVSFIPVEE